MALIAEVENYEIFWEMTICSRHGDFRLHGSEGELIIFTWVVVAEAVP